MEPPRTTRKASDMRALNAESPMPIQYVGGLDLVKNVFSIHITDLTGMCRLKKTLSKVGEVHRPFE